MSQSVLLVTREDLAAIIMPMMQSLHQMTPEVARLEMLKRKETLDTQEVQDLYGINANTLRKMRTTGIGPAYSKLGDRVVYTHTALKRYLDATRQKTHDQP